MKTLKSKKGFTIVELVIVIAVIAILAAVMIPTFSNVIEKANASAVQQVAAALYKEAYAIDLSDGKLDGYDKTQTASSDDDKAINKMTIDNVKGYSVKDNATTYFDYSVTDGKVKFIYTDGSYTATFENGAWTTK